MSHAAFQGLCPIRHPLQLFTRAVIASHDEPLGLHVSIHVFDGIQNELLNIWFLEVLAKCRNVLPYLIDNESVRVGPISVDMELKCPRFGSDRKSVV